MLDTLRDEITVDARTIDRYKKTYNIPADADVTAQMVEQHWVLERSLTKMLLASPPESRQEVWDQAYSRLYRECWWLQKLSVTHAVDSEHAFEYYLGILGAPCSVYEVGSGDARLIRFLAARGFDCVATEITLERGARETDAAFAWHLTDGVHLDKHEPNNRYQIVLSQQVLEHIHPADVAGHLTSAHAILAPGGKYVLATPQKLFGPADLSAVFEKSTPMCMHLKEYTNGELADAFAQAGYRDIKAVYLMPGRLRRYLPVVFESSVYLRYLLGIERAMLLVHDRLNIRIPKVVLWCLLINRDVFLTARKPDGTSNH